MLNDTVELEFAAVESSSLHNYVFLIAQNQPLW